MNSTQKIKISNLPDFDVVDYLKTEADIAGYLTAVLEDGDPALFIAAIGDISRAKGMSDIAKKSGVTRESLYRALKIEAHPRFETVIKVIHALGMKLCVEVEWKKNGLQMNWPTKAAPLVGDCVDYFNTAKIEAVMSSTLPVPLTLR